MSAAPVTLAPGLVHVPGYLDLAAQTVLLDAIRAILQKAPPFTPRMPRTGKPFSVRMSNCGPLGWVSDAGGYHYQPTHPETGAPWPPMPNMIVSAWRELGGYVRPPEACLINIYEEKARMGLHQDRDEADLDAPVVKIGLVSILMQAHAGFFFVDVDETGFGRAHIAAKLPPGAHNHIGHRRPWRARFGMRRLIVVTACVRHPAERAAVAHPHGKGFPRARHPRRERRRFLKNGPDRVEEHCLGG